MADKLLGGRYSVLDVIGEGGMATVYRARDTLLGRIVAIKVLRPQYASDAEFRERFRREAQSAAALSHPNIVNVYDVGEDDGSNFIVMELVDGRPLSDIIASERRLSPEKAVDYGIGILDALEHAHANGVIHRDIKPHNILITRDGRVKVADFGIARAASASALTETGKVMGTVNYTSPEQAKGEAATAGSDIYSTGLVIYEMLCGRVPFVGDTPVAVALKHVQDQPTPLSLHNPSVPPQVERVVMRALAKQPEDRWRTSRAFRNALAAARNASPPTGRHDQSEPVPAGPASAANRELDITRPFEAGEALDLGKAGNNKPAANGGRKPRIWAVAVAILVVAIGLAIGITQAFKNWIQVEEVTVPELVGLTLPEAEAATRRSRLMLDSSSKRYDNDIEYNRVISQEPLAGSKRKVHSAIRVTVSLGAEMATVPDLFGKTPKEAKFALEGFGLSIGEQLEGFHESMAPGKIIEQDPEAGTYVSKGSQVAITLSAGPPPPPPEVPLVIGMREDMARQTIEAIGLVVGSVSTRTSLIYESGTVVDQTPRPYVTVDPGTTVDLVIAERGGGDVSTSSPRRFAVTYQVQPGPEVQEIVIKVIDSFGERISYGPRSHRPGDSIAHVVEVYGSGKIEVWVDGRPIKVDDV